MPDLARPDECDAVRGRARDDAPRGPRDGLRVPEAVLKCDEDRPVCERTQRYHRVRGVVRFRRDEYEIRFRALRYSHCGVGFRDNRRLSGDAQSVGFDGGNVLRPPDERHIMPLGKKASEEAADRARTEHENFHDSRDAGALQNGFDVRFASPRFYINRKMDVFLSLRYF